MNPPRRRSTLPLPLALVAALALPGAASADVFPFTGAEQTYTVPAGVDTVRVEAIGGSGAAGSPDASMDRGAGGRGDRVRADLPVTPGQRLFVLVGGTATGAAGGFNGGGDGGTGSGGGGGASDVRTCSAAAASCGSATSSLATRLLVAGAGGGAGKAHGAGFDEGGDGGDAGQDGDWGLTPPFPSNACGPGGGATTSTTGSVAGQNCNRGEAGGFGVGGDTDTIFGANPGGGGGAGWLGGAGAAASGDDQLSSGGGGGSSYAVAGARNVSVAAAPSTATSVTITPLPADPVQAPEPVVVTQTVPGPPVFVPGAPAASPPQPLATAQTCRRTRRGLRCTLTLRTSALGLPRSLRGARFELRRGRRVVARGTASVRAGRLVLRNLRRRSGEHVLTIRTGRGRSTRVRARRAVVLG